ncbi:BTB/POZ domain-containing protein 17 isoform X1 [Oxyura jamaicensis]|uniref:BTB/POZ domain-containing protein 17 isoform X1 n=1 Tax=Oxyura jamaicensis TaxID=8884 RepID=UPI0015A64A47|nr:BTB/POZ domain-containing protein 17 isoform X1 [Oxyura jamaicensis]
MCRWRCRAGAVAACRGVGHPAWPGPGALAGLGTVTPAARPAEPDPGGTAAVARGWGAARHSWGAAPGFLAGRASENTATLGAFFPALPLLQSHGARRRHGGTRPSSAAAPARPHLGEAQRADLGGDATAATINHSLTLLQRLQELLQNGNSSDSVLRVRTAASDEAKVFHTHQLLLSLQSEVFEGLLRNQSVVTLHEPPETAALFEKFIRYLYCGGVSILLHQAIPMHQLASKYRVWGLQRGVADYMKSHLASESSQGHVVGWYHYAVRVGDAALQESCLQFLAWNLSAVLGSAEWASVSVELLLLLLERSDLVLHSELELYTAVESWLSRRQPEDAVAERVLRAIRYPMIAPSQLFRLQAQSAVLARHHGAVQDLLFQAFQFHAASPLHFAKYFDVNCSMFLPRNYLAPSWGSQWVINNPARDDRSTSFQTQLGPSSHDAGKRLTWNALFSPRWLPVSLRPVYSDSVSGAVQAARIEDGRPRLVVTPAMSSPDFAGVSFQKTVLVGVRQQGRVLVKHAYSFHQSSDEAADFLAHADLQKRTSEYLIDNSLHLHIIIKPVYHSLIKAKK